MKKGKLKEENTERVYCRYMLIDIDTAYVLIVGEKWSTITALEKNYELSGTFRSGFFFRKITQYIREINVKGRKCFLVMWANAPQRKVNSYVSHTGRLLSLKGQSYDNVVGELRLERFVRLHLRG